LWCPLSSTLNLIGSIAGASAELWRRRPKQEALCVTRTQYAQYFQTGSFTFDFFK